MSRIAESIEDIKIGQVVRVKQELSDSTHIHYREEVCAVEGEHFLTLEGLRTFPGPGSKRGVITVVTILAEAPLPEVPEGYIVIKKPDDDPAHAWADYVQALRSGTHSPPSWYDALALAEKYIEALEREESRA